jgi:hypothetical protein
LGEPGSRRSAHYNAIPIDAQPADPGGPERGCGQAAEGDLAGDEPVDELAEEPFPDEPDDPEDEDEDEDVEEADEDELAESPLSFFGEEPFVPDSLPADSGALRESVR